MGKDLKGKELGKGISQRKDGKYMARFVDRYKKRHTYYDDDVKALRRRLEKERYESEHMLNGNGGNITVTEWFEDFVELYKEGKVKETTVFRIRQTYAPCKKDMLGSMYLRDVRAHHIQRLINHLHEDGNTFGTIKLLKCLLGEMFKKAVGNGLMMMNPCDAVVMPKKEKKEPRFLTEKEQAMFLDAAREYYHYDVFCANLSCGMRIGELLALKWSDIDFDKKTIDVQRTLHYSKLKEDDVSHFFFTTPKNETSERKIELLPETEKILKRVRKKQLMNKMLYGSTWKQEEPFVDMVFTSQYGAPVRYGDVNRTIKKVILNANLQEEEIAKYENREPFVLMPFSPHCFRHTFVTRCKANNIPYKVIAPYVGHGRVEMTAHYDHNREVVDMSGLREISFLNVV